MNFAAFIDFLRQQGQAIKEAWAPLDRSAKVMIVGIGLLVAGAITVLSMTGGDSQYVTLADNLDATQIGEATTLLEGKGIPYKLDESRRSISVLPKDRAPMLLELERNNLPVGQSIPTGFEDLFDSPDLMSNQWLNNVNFMRAIQGELQRQLNEFTFIDYSYALIREADQKLFVDEQLPSEAIVTISANRPVSKQETNLIVSMISRAGGANLHPGNITVATTDGITLHNPSGSEFASIANDKLEYQNEVERRIEDKISRSLNKLGIPHTVMVSAAIDFNRKEIMEDKVEDGTALSLWKQDHTMKSTEGLPEGAPGAIQNIPEGAAASGGIQTEETTKDTLTNFEPSRTTTRTTTDPGDVIKYSIALVVEGDDFEETEGEDGAPTKDYVGITEGRRQAVTYLAQRAALSVDGAETEVEVIDRPFNIAGMGAVTDAMAMRAAAESRAWTSDLMGKFGLLVAFVLAFFLLRHLMKNATVIPGDEDEEEDVKEIPAATLEDMRRQEVAAEISQLSMDDPEAIAALLRSWMSEEED